MTPNAIAADYRGKSPLAHRFAKEWQERNEIARVFLEKAAKRMKKWADEKRRPRDFRIGDLVLIKIQADKVHAFRRNVHQGLIRTLPDHRKNKESSLSSATPAKMEDAPRVPPTLAA